MIGHYEPPDTLPDCTVTFQLSDPLLTSVTDPPVDTRKKLLNVCVSVPLVIVSIPLGLIRTSLGPLATIPKPEPSGTSAKSLLLIGSRSNRKLSSVRVEILTFLFKRASLVAMLFKFSPALLVLKPV